jgi:hypothetical protein
MGFQDFGVQRVLSTQQFEVCQLAKLNMEKSFDKLLETTKRRLLEMRHYSRSDNLGGNCVRYTVFR